MSFPSFRRFLENKRARFKEAKRTARTPARTRLFLEALEHRLAPATLQDVLPAAIVTGQRPLTTTTQNLNPQVAVDPIHPNKIFEVHSTGVLDTSSDTTKNTTGGIAGFYSTDNGNSFGSFNYRNVDLPQFLLPLTTVDPVSVAIDRNEEVYVVFSIHTPDNASGAIELVRFNFTGGAPTQDGGTQSLYTWSNSDPAFNPSVIVDSNVPSYVDPQTGRQTTDTMSGKAVYVVWNTHWTNPSGVTPTTDDAINVVASGDKGLTFSSVVRVGSGQGNHPTGFFTQGTPTTKGGVLNIFYDTPTDPNANNTSAAAVNQSRPDSGVANQSAVAVASFNGGTGGIGEATAAAPVTTKYFLTLTADQFPGNFGQLASLDVVLGLIHADVRELSAQLVSPIEDPVTHLPITVTLFNNHLDHNGNPLTQGIPGANPVANMGEIISGTNVAIPGTIFDSVSAHRSIVDTQNVAPFVGTYRPEAGSLSVFNGFSAKQLAGTWELDITDFKNDGTPTQHLDLFKLNFTSAINTSGFGTTHGISLFTRSGPDAAGIQGALPSSINNTYATALTAAGTPGVGPHLSVAVDNTLGSFSPHQGTMYLAYTAQGITKVAGDTDVYLLTSTDGGQTWTGPGGLPLRINNDSAADGFSEGDRAQFMPQLAVDPVTGTLVATWYDARFDASNARVATFLATSIDGGNTFSPEQVYLNASNTAIDAIANKLRVIEPIPSNAPNAGTLGFGEHQGLAVYGGHVYSFWSGNANDVNSAIFKADVTIAAGPRVLLGDQGPIGQGGLVNPLTTGVAADGTPVLEGFTVTYDRPVDPSTITTSQVQLQYHKPSDAAGKFTDLTGQVTGVQPLDLGVPPVVAVGGAIVNKGITGNLVFAKIPVVLSLPQATDTTVSFTTINGTAVAGIDYTATSGSIVIKAGLTSGFITVPILPNNTPQGNRTFNVQLTSADVGIVPGQATATVSIVDDDFPPLLTVSNAIVQKSTNGAVTATFHVFLSQLASADVVVTYSTADGTAVGGTDYGSASGATITIKKGDTTGTISIPVLANNTAHGNLSFFLNITKLTNATSLGGPAVGTIVDAANFGLTGGDLSIQQGPGVTAQVPVYLSAPASHVIHFTVQALDGTAHTGTDYTAPNPLTVYTISAGQVSALVPISILNPSGNLGNRFFTLQLTSGDANFLQQTGTVTIFGTGALPSVTVGDLLFHSKAFTSGQIAKVPVQLSFKSNSTVTVQYTITGNGDDAASAGVQTLNFAPGVALQYVNVPIASESTFEPSEGMPEPNEQFTVNVIGATNATTLGRTTGTGTIVDDNIWASIDDATTTDIAGASAKFTIYLNAPAPVTETVFYSITDGTAKQGTDYNASGLSGSVTFNAGDIQKIVAVPVVVNSKGQDAAQFTFKLTSASSGVGLMRDTGTGTIIYPNATKAPFGPDPVVYVGDASGFQNPNGTTTLTFTIFDNVAQGADLMVDYATMDGSGVFAGTAPKDYVAVGRTAATIAANATTVTVTVTVQSSSNPIDREFFVKLFVHSGTAETISTVKGTGDGWIEGNSLPDHVTVSGDVTTNDGIVVQSPNGSQAANFTISLSRAVPAWENVVVHYFTSDGSAHVGTDYLNAFGSVTFGPSDVSKTVSVTVPPNASPADVRNYFLNIFGVSSTEIAALPAGVFPTVYSITVPTTTGLIVDDPKYALSIGDATVTEVSSGTATMTFTVSLSAPAPPAGVSFNWSTLDGTAVAGNDYTANSSVGAIAAGKTSTTIKVTVLVNPNAVLNRFFHVVLSTPTDAALDRAVGTGTILEDDALPTLTISDAAAKEGDAAGMAFTAYLSFSPFTAVTVNYNTQDGTGQNAAKAGTDYTGVGSTMLTFNGTSTQSFTVPLIADPAVDNNEAFTVQLSTPGGATIAQGVGTGLIVEKNSLQPTVNVGDALVRQGYFGQHDATFTILLSNRSTSDVKVAWTTVDGTAVAGVDYVAASGVATIAAGQFSTTITVPIIGDSNFWQTATRQFFVRLTSAKGAQVGLNQAVGTILNDNGPNGATQFLVSFTPQSLVGDYSYTVGPSTQDRIRTATAPASGTAKKTFVGTGTPLAIPAGGTASSSLVVPLGALAADQVVGDLAVNLTLAAYHDGNLTIRLFAPNGTSVVLAQNRGGNGTSFVNTTFDFNAATPIAQGSAPFTGTFRPDEILRLNGLNPSGLWTLQVTDNGSGQPVASALVNWSLSITPATVGAGTAMDQDQNAVPGQGNNPFGPAGTAASGDLFAAPGPVDRSTPALQVAYDPNTLPLIIPGPHVVAESVPGVAPTADNLTLDNTAAFLDVVFDRDIDAATFTPASIVRMFGPFGNVQGPFTITPNPSGTVPALAKRTFRIGFPTQTLSGSYSIVLAPTITDVDGNQMDVNLNAGLDTLRGNSVSPMLGTPITYTQSFPSTINANSTLVSTITITDQFVIQQDAAHHIQLQLNIQSIPFQTPINDPDLVAVLIAPDKTVMPITLFTNVGKKGTPPRSNFNNTAFDDFATQPIQTALPPFDVGPFKPQLPLSQIKGISSTGTWTLQIINQGSTSGTLTNWSLTLPPPVLGNGLGEPMADQTNADFRIFQQDPTNARSQTQWTAVGGAALTANSPNDHAGRIGGLAVDPSDPSGNTVYAAGASGGVWKTNNFLNPSGPTWLPLTDLGPGTSLNIGGLAVFGRNGDTNQSVLFAATGEGDALPTNNAPLTSAGVGILRSTDGGKSWVLLDSLTNVDANGNLLPMSKRGHEFVGLTSFKVIVDPKPLPDGNVAVYAAFSNLGTKTNGGVYRSIDSGNHWQLVRGGNATDGNATDVVLAAGSGGSGGGNLHVLYAAFEGEGVYMTTSALTAVSMTLMAGGDGFPTRRNTDNGDVAIPVTNPASTPNGANGRIVLATPTLTNEPLLDTNYQGWLYALVVGTNNAILNLYLTKDFGHNWTQLLIPFFTAPLGGTFPTNNELATSPYNPLGFQGNYDVSLAIDPTNPSVVYIGGQDGAAPTPTGGLIRVDVTKLEDPYALVKFDNRNNDGGLTQVNTVGTFDRNPNNVSGILSNAGQNYYNIAFDPINPFLTPSNLPFTNVTNFHNDGGDLNWNGIDETFLQGSTDQHRLLAVVDQITGKTRLIAGDDQGIFTTLVNSGNDSVADLVQPLGGTIAGNPDAVPTIFGSRNGNIQITQFYYGAVQPSSLAAEIQGALFYGMAQDDGFPISTPDVLRTGHIGWTGPLGDGTGVATDQTGSGQVYEYRWMCCGAFPLPEDFFLLQLPHHQGQDFISRVTGLLNHPGEFPNVGGSNFTVNPIDPTAIVMSSQAGRIYRTSGPLTGTGVQWFEIAGPETAVSLDGTYAPTEAFGAPNPKVPGVLDDFIYVGTTAGNIWVTTTGGTSWTEFTTANGLDGSAVQKIVADPTHGSDDAYAVTLNGVYFNKHATNPSSPWTNISGNLFSLKTNIFNDLNQVGPTLAPSSLHALAADWRYNIPDISGSSTHPVLYVGGTGGVYRSDDKGAHWRYFPSQSQDGAAIDGGLLPNTIVTDLNFALGDINPATGLPTTDPHTGLPSQSTGFDMLVATTFGRGTFAIRLPLTPSSVPIQGPAVSSVADSSDGSTEAITVTFSRAGNPTPVDPATMTPSRIVIKDPNGNVLPVRQVIDIAPSSSNGSFHNIYRVLFTGTTAGKYTISIGPNVSDFSGNQMDQNGNGINGENPGDVYSNTVSITPAARPTVGVPFADSFAGSFGDSLGRQWVETNGFFLIQPRPGSSENVAVAQFAGENRTILQLATAQANVVVQADVDPTSSTNYTAGLLARFVDGNNYYLGELQSQGGGKYVAKILKAVAGTLSLLNTASVTTGGGTLRFEVVGNSLKLFLNDTLATYAEDADITAAGKVGFRGSFGTSFGAFSVDTLSFLTAPLPFNENFSTPGASGQLDRYWVDQIGNIGDVNGQAVGQGATNLSTLNGINVKDVKVTADLNLGSGQTAGLVTRYGGPLYANFYLAQLRDTGSGFQAAIFKNIGGTFFTLGVGATISGGTGTLEFEAVGPSLKLLWNGVVVAFADDGDLTTGSVGMRISQGTNVAAFHAETITTSSVTIPPKFTDTFTTASDGSQLDRQWTDQLGNISVNTSTGQAIGASGTNLSTVNGIKQGDVKVLADINLGSGQTAGLVARYGGPLYANFYLGQLRDTGSGFQAAIFKNIGGAFFTVAVGSTVATANATLEFEVVGSSLKLILGGKLMAFGFDSDLTTGSVGMRISSGTAVSNFMADQVTVTSVTIPPKFSDDFSSPSDGSQLSRNWTDQLGNISINSSSQAVGVGDTNLSMVNGVSLADVTVQGDIDVTGATGQSAGLVARYSGPGYSNFYLAQLRNTGTGYQAAIFANVGGSFTLVKLGLTVSSGKGTLKFQLVGNNLELDLDGNVLATVVDSSITKAGSVGMRLSANATLANFSAT